MLYNLKCHCGAVELEVETDLQAIKQCNCSICIRKNAKMCMVSKDSLQIKMFFETKDQAIEWSKKNNEQFIVIEPKERKIKPKNYASNFDMNRKEPWTH